MMNRPARQRFSAACLALLACASLASAQNSGNEWDRVFPHVHYFQALIADVQEPRFSLSLLETDLFKFAPQGRERPAFQLPDPVDSEHDTEIGAGIGGSVPLLLLKEWPGHGGIVFSAQLGVFPRFRIEYPTRTDIGEDWYVGGPIEFKYDNWSGRFRIMHRSSHLGDELIQQSNESAQRIEFGGEFADFLVANDLRPGVRAYGGATWNFRSYTEILPALTTRGWHDTHALQAGIDARWYGWGHGHTGLVGGIDWQSQQRTNWRSSFSVVAGPALRVNERSTRLLFRYYHGPSSAGQFFMTPETYKEIEWVVEF